MGLSELNPTARKDIEKILEKSFPEEEFDLCKDLIERARYALLGIDNFIDSVADNFFEEKKDNALFHDDETEVTFSIQHYRNGKEENLSITRNFREKINLHTYILKNGSTRSTIKYWIAEEQGGTFFEPYKSPSQVNPNAIRIIEELEEIAEV